MSNEIPLRNVWVLFLYAANLARFKDHLDVEPDESADLHELVARVLGHVVEQRLRRNLSRGYQPRHAVLSRVRGRIDQLRTATGQLLERGLVACHFEEHTMDTARNRLVRAALEFLSIRVNNAAVAHNCRSLAQSLARQGVSGSRPSRAEMAADQISRNDMADQLMVALSSMALELQMPSEQTGAARAVVPDVDVHLLRRLFEKAVGNALRMRLQPQGWMVNTGRRLDWPLATNASQTILDHLPAMQTDIELQNHSLCRKLVIDTKFTNIFAPTQYRENVLKSGYLYQLYTYLRTQESYLPTPQWISEGMLLHPQVGGSFNEHIDLQGHRMRFKTIDLSCTAPELESQLLGILEI